MPHCHGVSCEAGSICECLCAGCLYARRAAAGAPLFDVQATPSRVRPVILGFSSEADVLVPPGGTVEVKRVIQRGSFRAERLEVHPTSAKAFDVQSSRAGREAIFDGQEPVCLAVFPSASAGKNIRFKFSPRVVPLHLDTLKVGEVIKMVLLNVSSEPARFRANLFGVGSDA